MVLMDLGPIPLITPVVTLVVVFFMLKTLLWVWGSFFKMIFDRISRFFRRP